VTYSACDWQDEVSQRNLDDVQIRLSPADRTRGSPRSPSPFVAVTARWPQARACGATMSGFVAEVRPKSLERTG
jgi:hypothetical protein